MRLATTAAFRLADREGYAAALFGAGGVRAGVHVPTPPQPLLLLAPLGALLVAWIALARVRPLARLRVALQRNKMLVAIARVHDGNSGQYVAWIVATATLAATLTTASLR